MGILCSRRNRVHPKPVDSKKEKKKETKGKEDNDEVEYNKVDQPKTEKSSESEEEESSTSTTPVEIVVEDRSKNEEEIKIEKIHGDKPKEVEISKCIGDIIEQSDEGQITRIESTDLRQSLVIEQEDDDELERIKSSDFRSSLVEEGFETLKNHLTFKVITWNLQGNDPPSDETLDKILGGCKEDIIAIGTQECSRSIAKNFIYPSKMKWEAALKKFMFPDYVKLRSNNLVATHLIIFIKGDLLDSIRDVKGLAIPTGWMNDTLGNKGGVIVSFFCNNNYLMFICCHLTHRQSNHDIRDSNYIRIINELNLWTKQRYNSPTIFNKYDAVFIFGDLNYRINGNRKLIDRVMRTGMTEILRNNDQLQISRKRESAFHHFEEGDFEFPPTYKFDNGTNNYDTSEKQRVPSWTDRVLYYCKEKNLIKLTRYDAVMDCMYSDHRPVFGTFIKRMV